MATHGPEELLLKNGKRVVIRHSLSDDAIHFPAFQKQVARETVFTLQTEQNTPSVEQLRETWETILKDPLSLRLNVLSGEKIVAQLGFSPQPPLHPWTSHIGRFGMMVLQEYWGQGIARRLLEIMEHHARSTGFSRIEAQVRCRNDRGVKLYQAAGFSIEGTRRQAARIQGEFWDEFYIAKLLDPNTG